MPTYTTVTFQIPTQTIKNSIVSEFYFALCAVRFESKALRVSPLDVDMAKLSMKKLIDWNQERLENSIFDDKAIVYLRDAKQVQILGTPYKECRLFIDHVNGIDYFCFHLIVPEDCVFRQGSCFLKAIAKTIIKRIPIDAISTSDETNFTQTTIELEDGNELSVQHFGYVKSIRLKNNQYFMLTKMGEGTFIEYQPDGMLKQ